MSRPQKSFLSQQQTKFEAAKDSRGFWVAFIYKFWVFYFFITTSKYIASKVQSFVFWMWFMSVWFCHLNFFSFSKYVKVKINFENRVLVFLNGILTRKKKNSPIGQLGVGTMNILKIVPSTQCNNVLILRYGKWSSKYVQIK